MTTENSENKLVVLGVSGGIAAYRSCELARLLVKAGFRVQVIMTEYASRFVGPLTFQALTGRPVEVGHGGTLAQAGMDHIDLGQEADLVLVAPATANTLAKLACGMADNLLTTTVLASTCPVLVAPAMNTRMYANTITQENLLKLLNLERFFQVGPDDGDLACGESGPGRMSQPEVIFAHAQRLLSPQDLAGRRLLVSAGPTREAIDPVRFLSNRSSGRMGVALAAAAWRRGADVTLVAGPGVVEPPEGLDCVRVTSAAEMAKEIDARALRQDAVIMAAAVSDFRPRRVGRSKHKKAEGAPDITFVRTADILAGLGRKKSKRLLVGFAAETGDPVPAAIDKLKRKKVDLVVANDVSQADAGFEVETNRVHLVDASGVESLPLMTKTEVAERIVDRLVALLPQPSKRKTRAKRR